MTHLYTCSFTSYNNSLYFVYFRFICFLLNSLSHFLPHPLLHLFLNPSCLLHLSLLHFSLLHLFFTLLSSHFIHAHLCHTHVHCSRSLPWQAIVSARLFIQAEEKGRERKGPRKTFRTHVTSPLPPTRSIMHGLRETVIILFMHCIQYSFLTLCLFPFWFYFGVKVKRSKSWREIVLCYE